MRRVANNRDTVYKKKPNINGLGYFRKRSFDFLLLLIILLLLTPFFFIKAKVVRVSTATKPVNHIPLLGSIPKGQLIFDDEFNGTSLDIAKWNIEDDGSRRYRNCCLNYRLQYYTPQALSFVNGSLRITTEKQTIGSHSYTSGAITTENKFSFLYGRIDVRAKLPKSQGYWPSIWLLPDGSSGSPLFQIDVMELFGSQTDKVYTTNHWGSQEAVGSYIGPDFSQNFHVFSIIWNPQTITWYIDGVPHFQTTKGISNHNMYVTINSGLGGRVSNNPDKSTITPQFMDIDYVRVYQTA